MSESINERDNERAIAALKKGLDTSWDLLFYGDKASNTKPGDIRTYGTIAGQREVLKDRLNLREKFAEENNERF